MFIQCEPVGGFEAVAAQRHDAPGVVSGFAFDMCAYFGGVGAVFGAAGAHILLGDALPVL